jgi:hypothetical protein
MINVCCVFYGKKYSSDYVQRLYNMVQRHLTVPHQFYCFTDHINLSNTVRGNIIYKDFPLKGFEGWWNKLQLFNKDIGLEGVNLYFDLDVVILKNIDCFATYGDDNSFSILKEFNQPTIIFNSSIIKWNNKTASFIWNEYDKNFGDYVLYNTDQHVITKLVMNNDILKLYPDEWTFSYKWFSRKKPRYLISQQTFELDHKANVAIFHGKPNPHESEQQWVKDNWK